MASSWSKLLLASTFWLRKKKRSNDGALSEITDSMAIARLIVDTTHDHQDLDLRLAYDAWKQGGISWWNKSHGSIRWKIITNVNQIQDYKGKNIFQLYSFASIGE